MKKDIYKIIIITIITIAGITYAGWTNPSSGPVGNNTEPPIHTGSASQIKNGAIGVDVGTANQFCFANGECITSWQELCDEGYLNCDG